jgi:DNA replication and repair protein RecF
LRCSLFAAGERDLLARCRLIVEQLSLRGFRSYPALELALEPGFVLVVGANGVGKTNLLEAVHVGAQGFSPRTRADARLVRFGEATARVTLTGSESEVAVESEVTIQPGEAKRVRLNGAPLASAEELRRRLTALAFTPDRLAVVKGGPLVRRMYLDRMLGRVFPVRAGLPSEYGRALAQRNAALRGVAAGASSHEAVAPWSERLAELGSELEHARGELAGALGPGFTAGAAALGLPEATVSYEPRPLTVADLDERYERDLQRGTTGAGPHLRDVEIVSDGRDLRNYGSQGEQRTAVLALVLAEAALIEERRRTTPLLLLDDVLSELDETRRSALLTALPSGGQTVVTATSTVAVPSDAPQPDLVVFVSPGDARAA